MISMFQQGGQMNDEQKAFTAYLIKVLNPKDSADFEDKVAQLSENDLKEFYKQYKAMEGNQISMAKLGAKLSYVQTLRGECPEGYEVEKFMAGGCVKCKKKAEGAKVVDIFKDKCGGKAKKRVKKDQKGAVVNKADTVHTSKGVYNVSNKKLPYKKMTPADYKKLPHSEKVKVDMKDQANGKSASGAGAVKNKGIGKNYFGGTVQRRIIKQ
jgi:hypothetical protein|nr:MAG TPA: hypothetical protein [Caudoviricetes sp.]DAQ75786.1 MAG TPA: hypothetical protein [Caudoviricetes sp.]